MVKHDTAKSDTLAMVKHDTPRTGSTQQANRQLNIHIAMLSDVC